MVHFTSNTYQMKRQILSFSNKISRNLPKPERKFIADMNYGILASGSCLLIDIDDSDVVKPDGYKFESLGWVRDGWF